MQARGHEREPERKFQSYVPLHRVVTELLEELGKLSWQDRALDWRKGVDEPNYFNSKPLE